MHKYFLRLWLALTISAGLWLSQAGASRAQTEPPTPTPAVPVEAVPVEATPTPAATSVPVDSADVLDFARLGFVEETLVGPFASTNLVFNVPADWIFLDGTSLELHVNGYYQHVALPAADQPQALGGTLTVVLNDVTLATYLIDTAGERTLSVPIPAEALVPSRSGGRHELRLLWDSGLNCDSVQQANLVVRTGSRFILPHALGAPLTDLTLLPRPIYHGPLWPEQALIVVPDQPSAVDLQAALTVAAGFGTLTSGDLNLSLVAASELTAETKAAAHLILVGEPSAVPLLSEVTLPAPVSGTEFVINGIGADDGIVQSAGSPWNPSKVVLVVSGNSSAGVLKAAQAVSSGVIRVSGRPDLALVSGIKQEASPAAVAVDRTLADLGYARQSVQSIGASTLSYVFYVPPGQVASSESYLDLSLTYSTLLNYERSGLVVAVNDQPVGSIRFSDEAASGLQPIRLRLPPTAMSPGNNRLTLRTTLTPRDACVDPRLARLWLTVWPESVLHLPLNPSQASVAQRFDLADLHAPFVLEPTLNTTAFVVPASDPAAWRAASQIAFDLGNAADGRLTTLKLYLADQLPEEARQNQHLLLVGRPSTLALLDELRPDLPGPFEAGSDVATERGLAVQYRIPPDVSVGYLELLAAPWQTDRAILAVLGNSDAGLSWSATALTTPRLRSRLAGNFAVITGEQIVAADTRLGTSAATVQATAVPSGALVPVPLSETVAPKPSWLLPGLMVSLGLMVGVLVIAALSAARARRRA